MEKQDKWSLASRNRMEFDAIDDDKAVGECWTLFHSESPSWTCAASACMTAGIVSILMKTLISDQTVSKYSAVYNTYLGRDG